MRKGTALYESERNVWQQRYDQNQYRTMKEERSQHRRCRRLTTQTNDDVSGECKLQDEQKTKHEKKESRMHIAQIISLPSSQTPSGVYDV